MEMGLPYRSATLLLRDQNQSLHFYILGECFTIRRTENRLEYRKQDIGTLS